MFGFRKNVNKDEMLLSLLKKLFTGILLILFVGLVLFAVLFILMFFI